VSDWLLIVDPRRRRFEDRSAQDSVSCVALQTRGAPSISELSCPSRASSCLRFLTGDSAAVAHRIPYPAEWCKPLPCRRLLSRRAPRYARLSSFPATATFVRVSGERRPANRPK